MAIYLGSTEINTIYLGEAGYALPNVEAVYLGTTLVWDAEPTITFNTLADNVCTGSASVVGVNFSNPGEGEITYRVEYTVSDGSTATVQWQGSDDGGATWSAISGFDGYVGVSGDNLFMNYTGVTSSYWVRALVNTTSSDYYDSHPPCIP